jgi:dynein heavy chain, axonemal
MCRNDWNCFLLGSYLQVVQAFRSIPVDKLRDYWKGEEVGRIILDFLENPETQALFFREGKGLIEVYDGPLPTGKGSLFYIVKLNKVQISEKRIASEIVYGDITVNALEHMSSLAQRVFQPFVGSKSNNTAWSDTVIKEVREQFDSFVSNVQITQGHVQGFTCLPLPHAATFAEAMSRKDIDMEDTEQFRNIHVLEGALIIWTKQIKNVLKQDPEFLFQSSANPGPMAEVLFWRSKAKHLNSIFDQLQSKRIRRILKVLDQSKSTYNAPFAKLCKEVFHARAEANNIIKYLKPLIPWFEGLENEADFENLVNHFAPIIHLVLLVWKSTPYYNSPSRLVILMRELCNSLIRQASMFFNGDSIFELVDAGETATAVKTLRTVLRVCGKFKTVYFEYKLRASVECPNNPWSVQNNAVFVRLDTFLERCHDILDFAQTIIMFTKLAKIEVGGTKGKTLTTSIAQIFSDFNHAIESVRAVGKGMLDLDNKSFEEAFYEFRNRIKEMDRRLGSIIVQGFEDASTVIGRFRLLDSFDTLLTRTIVADALEKKHASLIESIRLDLSTVQKIFDDYHDAPVIPHNLPPMSGALTWCKSLRDRIELPITKLKLLDKKILERDDSRDVIKMYTSLVGQLADLDRVNIERWGEGIEASSQAKLKNPLLARESLTPDQILRNIPSLLKVNFDPLLVKLLREVKYFLLLGLEVPDSAMEIYQKVEVFRRHAGNLDLIVNMYNDIQTTLLPVERPLVKVQLDRVDKALQQGIGEGKSKGKGLNWKSNGIDIFISETMSEVKEVNEMLQMLKGNLKNVEQTVAIWQTQPLFERGYKTVLTTDFINMQKKTRSVKLQAVKEAGQEIHRLLKDTNKKLKVSQGLPDWKAYVDFINNVVVYGLSDAMASSLKTMAIQFNPVYLEANNLPALLEIQLDLVDKRVSFIPEVGHVEQDLRQPNQMLGIKNIVMGWINGMLGLANAFKRLDSSEGTYLRELSEAPQVLVFKNKVVKYLASVEVSANKLRNVFKKFDYLWTSNLNTIFEEFLHDVVQVEKVPIITIDNNSSSAGVTASDAASSAAATLTGNGDVLEGAYWEKTTISLSKFSEKIKYFLEVQVEVSEIKASHDVDFLKVNAQPIKQAISTWVTKWLYMHTQYLQDYVFHSLDDIFRFVQEANKGLDVTVEAGNRESLMCVLSYINKVKKRMPEIESLFEPMNKIVNLLKSNGITIDMLPIGGQPALDYLEHSKVYWNNTVIKAFRVKENVQPMQSTMLDGIRKEVKVFNNNVAKFVKDFRQSGPFNPLELGAKVKDAYISLDRCQRQLLQLGKESKAINDLEDLFELPLSSNGTIKEIEQDLKYLKDVWDTVMLVECIFTAWKNTLWAEIQTDDLLDEVKKIQNQLKRHPKKAKEWNVFKKLELEVKNMVLSLPLVHDLHSPSMRERHWKSLFVITGVSVDRGANFCLDHLLSLNLQLHVESVSEIVEVANKELKIETKLASIEEIWRKFSLQFSQHRDTEVFIVTPPDEVLEALEEHSLILQSMAGMGKFVEFFKEQVSHWQLSLGEVETTLKLILLVERQWGSLESIFLGSADIRAQLPDDSKRFEGVDAEFKEMMKDIQTKPGVLSCCRTDGRENSLINMHKELEKCEKALNEYLEIKKGYFPRFYFVSNAALLDILSNGNNPPKIMPHIGSVFDGVGDLDLCPSVTLAKAMKDEPEGNHGPLDAAKSMISKDGEIVIFPALFEMKGAVEHWLNELVKQMQFTLRGVLANSMLDALAWDDVNRSREDWVFTVPAQIALVTSQIIWTEEVESALEELESGQEDAMKKYNELCTARLEGLIRLVQMDLTKSDRIKIITVITIDVHNRDVVTQLVQKKVENNVDFKWQSQLRYYWQADERNVSIRICDFSTSYSFEYTGNCGRLVITPLTDRCYVTLTVALRLIMGGAPAGPAGTGKVCRFTYFYSLCCSQFFSLQW